MSTLAQRYTAQDNGFGFLRLVFAAGVLVAHGWPLGLAQGSPGFTATHGQWDLGEACVQGFFVVSGFLLTASAGRYSAPRFLWCRFLRIFPGLWACLLVTAFGFAPIVAYVERGGLTGLFSAPDSPVRYVLVNWFSSMDQYPIGGLLRTTPFGTMIGSPGPFDGSLWTLHYELVCYGGLVVLAATGVLARTPRFVAMVTAAIAAWTAWDALARPGWPMRPTDHGGISLPLFGTVTDGMLLYLGYLFLLGVCLRLFAHRVPVRWELAVAALAVVGVTLALGGFALVGLPAFAYLVLYATVTLPRRWRQVGRRHDYSYGVYIYAFPVQQLVALLGGAAHGLPLYLALSAAGTVPLAVLSWHLVERPALRAKAFDPRPVPRRRPSVVG